MISPACVSIGCEFVLFVGERGGGIGVGVGVMYVRESKECLEGGFGLRLEGDAIRRCGESVTESVYGC